MEKNVEQILRNLPSVDGLMRSADIACLENSLGRKTVVEAIRQALDEIRGQLRSGELCGL